MPPSLFVVLREVNGQRGISEPLRTLGACRLRSLRSCTLREMSLIRAT